VGYRFNFRDVFAQQSFLLEGLLLTLQLSFIAMALGLAVGVTCAAVRVYGPRPARLAVAGYVETIRNTPLLVQLFLVFFGLPSLGIRLDATTASIIALTVNLGAYATEIVRAGLEAIPRAQIEAGVSLGLSRMYADDLAQLEAGIAVYDALYRWCRDATDETHNWVSHTPAKGRRA